MKIAPSLVSGERLRWLLCALALCCWPAHAQGDPSPQKIQWTAFSDALRPIANIGQAKQLDPQTANAQPSSALFLPFTAKDPATDEDLPTQWVLWPNAPLAPLADASCTEPPKAKKLAQNRTWWLFEGPVSVALELDAEAVAFWFPHPTKDCLVRQVAVQRADLCVPAPSEKQAQSVGVRCGSYFDYAEEEEDNRCIVTQGDIRKKMLTAEQWTEIKQDTTRLVPMGSAWSWPLGDPYHDIQMVLGFERWRTDYDTCAIQLIPHPSTEKATPRLLHAHTINKEHEIESECSLSLDVDAQTLLFADYRGYHDSHRAGTTDTSIRNIQWWRWRGQAWHHEGSEVRHGKVDDGDFPKNVTEDTVTCRPQWNADIQWQYHTTESFYDGEAAYPPCPGPEGEWSCDGCSAYRTKIVTHAKSWSVQAGEFVIPLATFTQEISRKRGEKLWDECEPHSFDPI
jgi:hypothetical protein